MNSTKKKETEAGDSQEIHLHKENPEKENIDLISNSLYKEVGGRNGILQLLKVDEKRGLDMTNQTDISWRKNKWGENSEIVAPEYGICHFIWESLQDQMLLILLGAAGISLIIGILQEGLAKGWIEGSAIFFAVFIVVAITSFNNWSKDKQFHELSRENSKKNVCVRRNGKEVIMSVYDLLVGDILDLKIGEIVPVDGILLSGNPSMDESNMTGESELVRKNPQVVMNVDGKKGKNYTPFILSGTKIQDGSGEMVVCAVGLNSVSGRQMSLITEESDQQTPLQEKLSELADLIGNIGFIVSIVIGLVLIAKDIILRIMNGKTLFDSSLIDAVINAFIISVVVIVVAIPEGLPMAVTISLAYSVKKMKDENNLVRHLDAAETMGNVSTVCTDKTGTLTYGKMKLHSLYIKESIIKQDITLDDETQKLLLTSIVNNCTTKSTIVNGVEIPEGDSTEVALMTYAITQKNYKQYVFPKDSRKARLVFNSSYKFMASLYEVEAGKYQLFVKGAPEILMELHKLCKYYYNKNKKFEELSNDSFHQFLEAQEELASAQQRTILIGRKDIDSTTFEKCAIKHKNEFNVDFFKDLIGNGLQIITVVGIIDRHRAEVPEAIQKCKDSGVLVRMMTGDNILTGIAIAKEIGILNEREAIDARLRISQPALYPENKAIYALEGVEFRELVGSYTKQYNPVEEKEMNMLERPEVFRRVTKNLKVIGRASPQDKFLLVLGLQELDNIVAVTGDGANDAPALKKSDVGFAMGIRGTDIAKSVSDIVLLNDSFDSIITAMKYGRNVYDCIRKFLQFQLTTNIVAVFMTLLGGVILNDAPLNAIQMLWVNLIMDSFASLALATEPPSDKLLLRKPYPKKENIITPYMTINVISQSLLQIVILVIIIFYGDIIFDVPSDRELSHYQWNDVNGYHFTIFFNIFVLLQVVNSINARKLGPNEKNVFSNLSNNYLYIFVQLITLLGQFAMVQFGGRAIRTHPLTLWQHFCCLAIACLSLVVSLIVKFIPFGDNENEVSATRDMIIGGGWSTRKSMRNNKMLSLSISKK